MRALNDMATYTYINYYYFKVVKNNINSIMSLNTYVMLVDNSFKATSFIRSGLSLYISSEL